MCIAEGDAFNILRYGPGGVGESYNVRVANNGLETPALTLNQAITMTSGKTAADVTMSKHTRIPAYNRCWIAASVNVDDEVTWRIPSN